MQDFECILSCLDQPAFCLRDGKIQYANAAAQQIGLFADQPVQDAFQLPEQTQTTLQFSCEFAGRHWIAQSCLSGEDRLIFLRRGDGQSAANALNMVSRAIRETLQPMFSTAEQLFARLEEQEDETLQHESAVLMRGLYQMLRIAGNLADSQHAGDELANRYYQRTDCFAFLTAFAGHVQPLIESTGRQFSFQCPTGHCYARMSAALVRRAILNLLSNAVANTPEGGTITLSVTAEAALCRICVENDGQILSHRALSGILDRFELASPLDPAQHGAGFGLSIVRTVAARHGGIVLLEPKPEGGLRVFFTIERKLYSPFEPPIVRTPAISYADGRDPCLIELSDVLPPEMYDTRKI